MRIGRLGATAIAAAIWLGAPAAPALADAAGPTDYDSTIEQVEPAADGITAVMIGGDSFLMLTVARPDIVEVVGYQGEPYLRFHPDGTVEQNDRSPTTYLNEDRYATVEIPATASPDAAPEWRVVATDGSFAWHDHRTHWMNDAPPPGRSPGDRILEGVVPLIVDGTEVDVSIVSVWLPAPSPLPVVAGAALGVALAAWSLRRRTLRAMAAGAAVLAAGALGIGVAAYLSVPPETGPSWTLWVLPVTSLVLALLVVGADSAGRAGGLLGGAAPTLLVVATLELAVWGTSRWDWMWRAILPTDAPFWLDRLVTAAVLVGGVSLLAGALWKTVRGEQRPT